MKGQMEVGEELNDTGLYLTKWTGITPIFAKRIQSEIL